MKKESFFSAISEGFATFICRLEGQELPELTQAARLVCEAVNRGHVCLDLKRVAEGDFLASDAPDDEPLTTWPIAEWRDKLRATSVVGAPGSFHPLILDDDNRLYLYRYWAYENALAEGLLARSREFKTSALATLGDKLNLYFPQEPGAPVNWQRTAALIAASRSFSVISGGPGTGKTTTVVKILALLQEMAADRPLAIALAAPTGKAAARLKDAITRAKSELPCSPDIRLSIPEDVRTLHRLLGSLHHAPSFRHNADNSLPYDVVVVDEASMVDLPMMAKLVLALPAHASLILLGDKHQLASVEAGAVLGDICQTGFEVTYSEPMKQILGNLLRLPDAAFNTNQQSGPGDSLVTLQKNYRFGDSSGIGRLSTAINAGRAEESAALLNNPQIADINWSECPPEKQLREALSARILSGCTPYLKAASAEEALKRFTNFIVLCALRNGPFGVTSITPLAEKILADSGLIKPVSRWYKGRPIMITANDYNLGLFNGDTGIIWPEEGPEQRLRAYFPDQNGQLRSLSPSRLPSHETVFASTVHKSQGSEFDNVLLLLPPHDTRALTRELIYTGITRAKSSVAIWGKQEVFNLALQRRVQRSSGLRDAIWRQNSTGGETES